MRLRRLDLIRYGKFTGRQLDFGAATPGQPDFHIIFGPNEAGKSTTMQGWLDLLYGIPAQSRMNFLHAYGAMQIGAVIDSGPDQIAVIRSKGNKGTLTDPSGAALPESVLQAALGGIDRAAYEAMFSLDDDTLEKGGDSILSSQGDLGQMLFTASSGLADMGQALDTLRQSTAAIFKPGGRTGRLADLKKALADLDQQIADQDVGARGFALLAQTRDLAQQAWQSAQTTHNETRQRLHQVERLLATLPLVTQAQMLAARRDSLPQFPDLPRDWAVGLPDLIREQDQLRVRLVDHAEQMDSLQLDHDQAVDDPAILAQATALRDAGALKSDYDAAMRDLPNRRAEAAALADDRARLLQALGAAGADPADLALPAPVVASLRSLMAQYSGLTAAVTAARREQAKAQQRLDDLDGAAKSPAGETPTTPDTATLRAVMQNAGAVDAEAAVARAAQAARQAAELWAQHAARLAPWAGDGTALAALDLPDADRVTAWGRDLVKAEHDLAQARTAAAQLQDEAARITATLQADGAQGLVTLDHAAALRSQREALWAAHCASLDAASAQAFEAAMRRDDQATAALAQAQAAAQNRAEARGRLAQIAIDQARATEHADAAAARVAAIRTGLQKHLPPDLAPDLAPDLDPDSFADWLRHRAVALDSWAAWRAALHVEAASLAQRDTIRATLLAALAPHGHGMDPDSPLPLLLAQARVVLEQAQGQAARQAARALAAQELRDRRDTLAQAESALTDWQDRWAQVAGRPDAGDPPPDIAATEVRLDLLAQLDQILRDQARLQDRITKMEGHQARFETALQQVARALDMAADLPLDPARTAALWSGLAARLQDAQRGADQRQMLGVKLAQGQATGQALHNRLAAIEAQLARMGAQLGCEDTAALVLAVDQIATRATLQDDYDARARDICEAMGTDDLEAALAALAGLDRAALAAERDGLAPQAQSQSQHLQQLYADLAQAQAALDAVGGDDAVARLQEQRQTVLLEIEETVHSYLRQRLGLIAVDHALLRYRDSHRSAMMERASQGFRIITRGAYDRLAAQPEGEREVLIAIAADGASKLARDMSKGTRFQLYLALRVAGFHEIAAARSTVPFIADDILETFDDDRAAETFTLLGEMAQAGQVIYLTHHRHLCEIAQRVCPLVRVHHLG